MRKIVLRGVGVIALMCGLDFAANAETYGNFQYMINGQSVTITKYTGSASALNIPDRINGLPVVSIGDSAFEGCGLTSVTLSRRTQLGANVFPKGAVLDYSD